MFSVTILLVPYHVGIPDHRVGLGPNCLFPRIKEKLEKRDFSVKLEIIPGVDDHEGEIGRSFELLRRVSLAVARIVDAGSYPLVFAGNCNTSVAVAAGLQLAGTNMGDLYIVWMDAHDDAETPNTMLSGYFDGMGVSMLNGTSWNALVSTVPGHIPVPMSQVIYSGVRSKSQGELEKLVQQGATLVPGTSAALSSCLDYRKSKNPRHEFLIHADLDVLDPCLVGWANEFPSEGGLSSGQFVDCLVSTAKHQPLALTIASFMPGLENGKAVEEAAIQGVVRFMETLTNSA